MLFIYNLGIHLTYFIAKISPFSSHKTKLFFKKRENWDTQLLIWKSKHNSKPIIWMHVSSLGEYYQGQPIFNALFQKFGDKYHYLCTFFSPSGYEIINKKSNFFSSFYLPIDTKLNAIKFVDIVSPKYVLFVKYDFWINFLLTIKKKKIPCILIAGIFRKSQIFFKPYGTLFRKALDSFTLIFLQEKGSQKLLKSIHREGIVCGDPRIDNILNKKKKLNQIPQLLQFKNNQTIITIGSCWDEDLDKILEATITLVKKHKNIKIIIAPHDPATKINNRITNAFSEINCTILAFSNLNKLSISSLQEGRILLLDEIGVLINAYACSNIAFIGGGFGVGLHNILEPAAFKLPILFGNLSYHKFQEAHDLIASNSAIIVENKATYLKALERLITDTHYSEKLGEKNLLYLEKSKGATSTIVKKIISHTK